MSDNNEKRPMVAKDLYKIVYVEDPRISPDGQWIAYVHVAADRMKDSYSRNIWLAPTDGGEPVQVTRGDKDTQPRWSPDSKMLAFTSARNDKPQIYLLPIETPGGEPRPLTSMQNGASSAAWSPDGSQIAFLSSMNAEERAREDSGEEEEPPANQFEAKQRKERRDYEEKQRWDPRWVERIPYRQGTAFMDDRFAQVYVMHVADDLDAEEKKPRRLTDINAMHAPPKWTPDGKYLLTSRTVDPERDEYWCWSSLFRIDLESGENEQLTDESHADGGPRPSPDGKWIAYNRVPVESMSDAITRLTVISIDGGEPRDLNLEFDRTLTFSVQKTYEWAPDSSAVYFAAPNRGNVEIYKAPPEGGKVEKVAEGTMEVQGFDVGPAGGVAYVACTPVSPPELFRWSSESDEPIQLTSVNADLLDEVIVQETHEIHFTGPDGTELQGWYILPVGYEEGEKYSLAHNIHGGPHAMWGPSARTMFHEWQFHAACGYVVFYMNPRGGAGYGQKFMRDLHADWGDVAFEDLMAGVDEMLKLGFINEERMAVTGGSYGGYMTGWIVGHSDRYKSAVTQRGVYNLSSFYGTSDVPMLISNEYDVEPWEDHQLLWEHSPLAYADKVVTPLLIIHSDNDFRVPIEQAEQMFAFVRRATDTPVKLLRYPEEGHELSRSGAPERRISRLTEMVRWFDTYCQPERLESEEEADDTE